MCSNLEGLQTELSAAYKYFFQVIKQLEPDKWSQPGVSGHWSPKDIVSHLIGWDMALQEFVADPDSFNPDALYDIDAFNAKSVSERQHQSWDEVIDELQSSYINLQEALATVTAKMKMYDRVTTWLRGRTEDYKFHTRQIEEWIEQQGTLSK